MSELKTTFRLWSSRSKEAKDAISKEIAWRNFGDLSYEEKTEMLLHFKRYKYFWGYKTGIVQGFDAGEKKIVDSESAIAYAVNSMNNLHIKECYGKKSLEEWSIGNVYADFTNIFLNANEHVVYQMLSFYGLCLLEEGTKVTYYKKPNETDEEYEKRVVERQHKAFDAFSKIVNRIFGGYQINIRLTRSGFIPYQDIKILEDIYEPVLRCLSNQRWKNTERDLSDAFKAFMRGKPDGYSECMTHCYAAIEAFLQEVASMPNASIKNANIEAQKKELIPNDQFSQQVFINLLSVFEKLRQKHGDAHSKEEYANKHTAQLMLNLTMIYLQHCLKTK